ncbi:MAG: LptF/LptG family permease [Sulfurimonadaceae bacterium]|jgi:lipopolysaccharide export system permease protein|nr:LptF/LptG family permease [Sulfurimonadaceae bacterium]
MLAFKYISWHFIRYFLIILIALVMFFVGFDYMDRAEQLPDSANLVLIFLVYKSFFAMDMLLPLSLIFAMIATKISLIRSNALVSFYSLGYSRVDVLRPFVVVSTAIIILYIAVHAFAGFAKAEEFARNIEKNSEYLSPTRDLFFTYQDSYIYFSQMFPLQEKALGVRFFKLSGNSLQEVVTASEASYVNNYWLIKKAHVIRKPENISFDSEGIKVNSVEDLEILHGFRPKILDQVYEGKVNFTIKEAIEALTLLKDQNINIDRVKWALYKMFIHPFFVPCLVVIIFFFVPLSPRFLNISLFSFGAILASLFTWGALFVLLELSNNKTIPSELGVVFPVVLLFLGALRQWRKYRLAT